LKIIAGLGNPGRKYRHTRHNIGWMALDAIAEERETGREQATCGGLMVRCGELALFKPLGYMNLSGAPIAQLMRYYGVELEDTLVVMDDIHLPFGRIRLRPRGSAGGHRGIESVIQALGTDRFPRLRLGVGPSPLGVEWRDFVLGRLSREERRRAAELAHNGAQAALCWAEAGLDGAMNRFNAETQDS
jgi:PTH1 family peptidyl-tRNA hydrolase